MYLTCHSDYYLCKFVFICGLYNFLWFHAAKIMIFCEKNKFFRIYFTYFTQFT